MLRISDLEEQKLVVVGEFVKDLLYIDYTKPGSSRSFKDVEQTVQLLKHAFICSLVLWTRKPLIMGSSFIYLLHTWSASLFLLGAFKQIYLCLSIYIHFATIKDFLERQKWEYVWACCCLRMATSTLNGHIAIWCILTCLYGFTMHLTHRFCLLGG